jgi:hypothetical protein
MSEATATLVRPEKSIWESKKFWGTVIGGVCAVLSLLPFPWAKPVGLALAGLSAVFVGSPMSANTLRQRSTPTRSSTC